MAPAQSVHVRTFIRQHNESQNTPILHTATTHGTDYYSVVFNAVGHCDTFLYFPYLPTMSICFIYITICIKTCQLFLIADFLNVKFKCSVTVIIKLKDLMPLLFDAPRYILNGFSVI